MMTAIALEKTYHFIDGAGAVASAEGGPQFWANIASMREAGGTLVTVSGGAGAWPRWEMHPQGEEVLVFLEGEPKFWLEHPDGRVEALSPIVGSTVVVPRGVWHRAESEGPYKILFITYGDGTTHRPVTDEDRIRAAASQ
jgi:mannose-6-phosphate isomerase-like protein (cupin superfamily)